MNKICSKCQCKANIKINVLLYCKSCFESNIETKILRALNKITPKTSIFLYLENYLSSAVLARVVSKFFIERKLSNFEVHCRGQEIKEYLIKNKIFSSNQIAENTFDCKFNGNLLTSSDVNSYIISKGFNVVLFQRSIENVLMDSFDYICQGNGFDAVRNVGISKGQVFNIEENNKVKGTIEDNSNIIEDFSAIKYELSSDRHSKNLTGCPKEDAVLQLENLNISETFNKTVKNITEDYENKQVDKSSKNSSIRAINVFNEVKEKEIIYYAYINSMNFKVKSEDSTKTKTILHDFLLGIDSRNNLALYNILNTLKKME